MVLVSLGDAEEHECHRARELGTISDINVSPGEETYGCEELFLMAMEMNLWIPSTLNVRRGKR